VGEESSKPSPTENGEAEIGKRRYDGDEHQSGCGHHGHQAWTISLHMSWPCLIGILDLQRHACDRDRPAVPAPERIPEVQFINAFGVLIYGPVELASEGL
jgi:hypothetical protein